LLPFQKYFPFTFPEFLLPVMVLFPTQLPGNISVICAKYSNWRKSSYNRKNYSHFFGEWTTIW